MRKGTFKTATFDKVDLLARETTGMSGADIANIVNEALIHSVFETKEEAE